MEAFVVDGDGRAVAVRGMAVCDVRWWAAAFHDS